MKSYLHVLSLIFLSLFIVSCAAKKPWYGKAYADWKEKQAPPSSEIEHSVFLVGDAGKVYTGDKVMTMLRKQLDEANNPENVVVFLGDNIYPAGLPEEGHERRKESEKRLKGQMDAVKGATAWSFFIPGNHDWNDQGEGGLDGIIRQADYVRAYMESDSSFYPQNGCPGPVVIHPHTNLAVIIIDTEWWLHKYEKPDGPEDDCAIYTKEGLIQALKEAVAANQDKHIVITQHHPFFTNGNHGGRYRFWDHIFPLTALVDNLYVPLPVLGSIYVGARKSGISPEDVPGKPYQELKNAILDAVAGEKHVVISAGHEHILQYNKFNNVHHVLSGSGAKVDFARKGKGAGFVHMERGYARVNYYKDGSAWLEYWEPTGENKKGVVVFREKIYGPNN
ncbi:MAG: hypothetical protein AAFR87_09535 [Bacteroidota bacterium]